MIRLLLNLTTTRSRLALCQKVLVLRQEALRSRRLHAVLEAIFYDVGMGDARSGKFHGQLVDVDVALIADDELALGVEHAEAFGNILHRGFEQRHLCGSRPEGAS